MSSQKEKLKFSDKALRESLESQLSNLKNNFDDVGKKALWIGGGLIGVYALTKLLTSAKKKKKSKKITIQQAEVVKPVAEKPKKKKAQKEPLLSNTVKEQLIVLLLGILAQRLTQFLSELDKDETQNDSKPADK